MSMDEYRKQSEAFQKYLDEELPKVDTTPKPSKFRITIEEHISQEFIVEAMDIDEAMQIAEQKYHEGEFVVEPGIPIARMMQAESEDGAERTEWEEF